MVDTATRTELTALPLAPMNPLPRRRQLALLRSFVEGHAVLIASGGRISRITFGPKWLVPPIVLVATPQGAHDVLSRRDAVSDRGRSTAMVQMRTLMGGNLLDLPHDQWLPRRRALQPMFTKSHVPRYAGHMATAAQMVAERWRDGQLVDLDIESRALTLRALGRSVFGLDLDERADSVGPALRTALGWIADRASRPLNLPQFVPTAGQRRAREASATLQRLAAEILTSVRADPDVDAPLVRALVDASDPATGRALTDEEICHELVLFMLAGHDTTSTTLTYALWALGRHPDLQQRVYDEVAALGGRPLTPEDVPALGYTVRVLHEALRLCPPAAGMPRVISEEIAVDGHRVEAGTMLSISIYALHRDPSLWDDPLTFDPDRFLPERSHGRNRWQYLPFGGGPRSCIGDHFAMLEATLALATLVRGARIESLSADFPLATPFTVVAAAPALARVQLR